jgi:molybdopterin/thiamine biosynthesis adenylyltransferase
LQGHDAILDALDNVPARLLLEKTAQALGIPLVHGAIHGWFAQVAVIMPGDRILENLYGNAALPPPSVPSFTPALCASLQVSETVKLLCGRKQENGRLFMFDLTDNSMNVLTMD